MGWPILFTQRLLLRVPEPRDFGGYAAFAADAATMAHLGDGMTVHAGGQSATHWRPRRGRGA